jgi:hypothetical protein
VTYRNPALEAARESAHADILGARRALEAIFGTADSAELGEWGQRQSKRLPTANEQRIANEVALAAQHVAQKTDALTKLLELHSTALIAIERAQAELATARKALSDAEVKRGSLQADSYEAVRTKHVVTDFERGLQAGRDYIAAGRYRG